MSGIDSDFLLNRPNVTRLRAAADAVSDNDKIPIQLRRYYVELESVLRRIEITLQDFDLDE